MSVDLRVPEAGESIAEVRIGAWHKSEGEYVNADEVVVELETDKAAIELPAPVSGILVSIVRPEGAGAAVGDVIGVIDEHSTEPVAGAKPSKPEASVAAEETHAPEAAETSPGPAQRVMPSAKRVLGEAGVEAAAAKGTGPGGRVLKEDAIRAVESAHAEPSPETTPQPSPEPTASALREEEIVPMSPLRKVIARNLVAAQQSAALLTTFNEVDMSAVIELRKRYKDLFLERHGIKLGFMSFFVKAAVQALERYPLVNACIDGDDIVHHDYCDIGVAVGSPRGLVVPVLRNAERLSFAQVERAIAGYGERARDGSLAIEDLVGGTFTISNGGVFGSLLSTPILNPPQSAILGMHKTQPRPVVDEQGEVVVRPMMYVALSYDHRIIDGREAVGFLVTIKEAVEDPARLLLEV